MKKAPTLAAIDAVESRLEESRRKTRDGLRRVRVALRAKAARPSTLAAAAGAAGLVGLWLARRPRRSTTSASAKVGVGIALSATAAAVGRTLLARYGVRGATFVLAQVRAAMRRRAERNAAAAAGSAHAASAPAMATVPSP